MRPPIHSQKHYVQKSLSTVVTVARNAEVICFSVAAPTAVHEIKEGSIVKAVYVELWTLSSSNNGSEIVTIQKDTNNGTGPTFTQMAALGTYVNKKNIFFTHQGLSPNDGVGNPVPVIRDWIKIPKSKQRFGLGDTLYINISNPSANTLTYCGFATYKEYT